ncbi:MAG: branched-chain amino acid transport system permease protein livM [Frankiales bacterium]|jgi:branched-chain amino acid transport system permease protein|nr:branched-chain amino acid transport system permease protein livM [Frankiales bacterium]
MAQMLSARVIGAVQPFTSRFVRTPILAPIAFAIFVVGAYIGSGHQMSYVIKLAITGIGPGAIAALSGMGLIVTYRATGVFNFAQGTIATLVGYLYWEMTSNHGVPTGLAALIAILIAAPVIGLVLNRTIFRPLERRGASTSEKLVASLGLTVLMLGVCVIVWGAQTRLAHNFLPFATHRPVVPFGNDYQVSWVTIGEVTLLVITSVALTALFRFTRLGTEIRAVVDKRELAELAAVNANRVSAISWALGCAFAGLVGVLYASSVALDPYRTTLLVIDTFAIAVIARLRDLPTALIAGIVLGVAQGMIGAFRIEGPLAGPVQADILAMALPIFLILYRNLDEVGTSATSSRGLVTARFGRAKRTTPGSVITVLGFFALVAAVPFVVTGLHMKNAQEMLALAVAFLSITAVTGFSGNITLGQAGFAGLGAFLTAKFSTVGIWGIPNMPVLLAMLLAAVFAAGLGVITGFFVLRRRGLILGLVTISMGVLLATLVFQQDQFRRGFFLLHRPSLFGLDLSGDKAFFWFELVVFALMLMFVRNLRAGRLGRILGAMRDSETGATAVGISMRKYKLFIFAIGAAIASIGGSLLMYADMAFADRSYSPLYSLFWFAAVVVAGLSYLAGAPLAAFLFIFFDAALNQEGASLFVIGLLSVLIAYLPGGLVGTFYRFVREGAVPRGLMAKYVEATQRGATTPDPATKPVPEPVSVVASPLARDLLEQPR